MKVMRKFMWNPLLMGLVWTSWVLPGNAATITVNSLADTVNGGDSVTTLREAINQANNGTQTTINLSSLNGTIVLTSDLPAINKNTVITGPNSQNVTIDGNNLYRVFSILDGEVTIEYLKISKAFAKGGNGASSSNSGCCGGGGGGMGAALFIYQGTVTCRHVNFANNLAQGGKGGNEVLSSPNYMILSGGGGGGFAGDGSFDTNSYFGGGGSGGILGNAGKGGEPGSVGIDGGNGGFGGGGGGAFWSSKNGNGGNGGFGGGGGGAWGGVPGKSAAFGGSSSGRNGGGGAGLGGAVFVRMNSTLVMEYCDFNNNKAQHGAGADSANNGQGKGGAIFAMDGANVYINALSMSENKADDAQNTGAISFKVQLDTPDVWGILQDYDDSTAFPPSTASNWPLYR